MGNPLYSVRMRASLGAKHVSGAERLVPRVRVDATVNELVSRALAKGCRPGRIVVSVDCLGTLPVRAIRSLDVTTLDVPGAETGRAKASAILKMTGVSAHAARTAIDLLSRGPSSSGDTMRGAMIIDARSGERLEPDRDRGIRASRFDWSEAVSREIDRALFEAGLTHYRTREALALATKVALAPGIVAELCWSDDPDYSAGYVASLKTGYVRFPYLKEPGDGRGGRAFFVQRDEFDLDAFTAYLQEEPVLITAVGKCRSKADSSHV